MGRTIRTWLAFALIVGCQAPTQVLVLVDGDDSVWANLTRIEIRVFSRDPNDVSGETERLVLQATPAVAGIDPPFEIPLAPRGRDARRRYRVQVAATLRGGGVIVARVISGYQANATRELTIYLAAECIDVTDCSEQQTCRMGVCVDATVDVERLCVPDDPTPICDSGVAVEDTAVDTAVEDTTPDVVADTASDTTSVSDMALGDTSGPDTSPMCIDPLTPIVGCLPAVCGIVDDAVACRPRGIAPEGASCASVDCRGALYCNPADRVCHQICDLGADVPCVDPMTFCDPITTVSETGKSYGFCEDVVDG